MESTRLIAGVLGAAGGGAASILINDINNEAERSKQLYDSTTNLNTQFGETDAEGKTMQKYHIRQLVQDAVLNDKQDIGIEEMKVMYEKGIVSEEELVSFEEDMDEYQTLLEQADALNVRGKVALLENHTKETTLNELLSKAEEEKQFKIDTV